MAPKLTLYVDTVSPFAYEAYYILRVRAIYLVQLAGTFSPMTSLVATTRRCWNGLEFEESCGAD